MRPFSANFALAAEELQLVQYSGFCTAVPALLRLAPHLRVLDLSGVSHHQSSDLLLLVQHQKHLQPLHQQGLLIHAQCLNNSGANLLEEQICSPITNLQALGEPDRLKLSDDW